MKISAQEEYGLRCLVQLANLQGGESLTLPQIAELEGSVNPDAIAGSRYQPAQMAHLDSER